MPFQKNLTVRRLLSARVATTDTQGAAVDLSTSINPGVRDMKAVLDVGALAGTAGAGLGLDVKLQHSDTTTAADFTDVSGAAFTRVTATAGGIEEIHFSTARRYVRAAVTFGTSATSATFGVYIVTENRVQ